jgi:hypothetical protein
LPGFEFSQEKKGPLDQVHHHISAGLAGDEVSATGCATLLSVLFGEYGAFLNKSVNVGGSIPHNAMVVGADAE